MCGRRCCSQRPRGWAIRRRIRRSCAGSGSGVCGRSVRRAHRCGLMLTSSIRPVRRSSGTGWSCETPRGAARRSCWWGCWRTRGGCGAGSLSRWTSPTWWRASSGCWSASGGPPGAGGPTAWPRWWHRARTGSRRRSRPWPSTTAQQSMCAPLDAPGAKGQSRRASTTSPSRGGAPLRSPRPRPPRRQLTAGASRSQTLGCAASRGKSSLLGRPRPASRCWRCRPPRSR